MGLPEFISRAIEAYLDRREQKMIYGVSGERVKYLEGVLSSFDSGFLRQLGVLPVSLLPFNTGRFRGSLLRIFVHGDQDKPCAMLVSPYEMGALRDSYGYDGSSRIGGKRVRIDGIKVDSLELLAAIGKHDSSDCEFLRRLFLISDSAFLVDRIYLFGGFDFSSAREELEAIPVREDR